MGALSLSGLWRRITRRTRSWLKTLSQPITPARRLPGPLRPVCWSGPRPRTRRRGAAWSRSTDRWSTARAVGLNDNASDNVVPEVFLAVAQHIGRFHHRDYGSFRAWLATIARHKIADLFRNRGNEAVARGGTAAQQGMLEIPDESLPSTAPQGQETPWHRCLELVRGEFEPQSWQVFWRVAVDGQPPAEVAAELNLSVGAVYKAKARVLHRVRKELRDLEGLN